MDRTQYKILKYLDKHRTDEKLTVYDLDKKFGKKYELTRKDIIEIASNLKKQEYIFFVGMDGAIVTSHKGHTLVKYHKREEILKFAKSYIYPILITTIGCLITHYLNNH